MNDQLKKAKAWAKEHEDVLVVAGMFTFYGLCIAAAVKVGKKAEQDAADRQAYLLDAINSGKRILPNPDGSYWVIDPENFV